MNEIVWNNAALHEVLQGPDGDVAKYMERVGIRVESQAKLNASGRPGPNVQSGDLRGSITHAMGTDHEGVYVDVGAGVYYAIYVEMGTVNAPPYPFLRPALPAASAA